MKFKVRGQFQFVALLITVFGLIIYAVIHPMVSDIINPVISGLSNDLTRILFQLIMPTLLLGIITWFFFLSSPSGAK